MQNEWYKAAYYNPSNASYWLYPTQSNTYPSNVLSATGTNNANFLALGYTDPTNDLTPVGAFAASPGPYGTYDMGGDVFQWNEANLDDLDRGMRGGYWNTDVDALASTNRYGSSPTGQFDYIGFRVASAVPEPGSVTLLVAGTIASWIWWWRRTRAAGSL